jgi:hypothetical protein
MSNEGIHVDSSGGEVRPPKPPTPKAIEAQSQSRNSFARIVVLGGLLLLLCVALGVALFYRPDNVKDILIVIGSIAGYMAGSGDFSRRDDK